MIDVKELRNQIESGDGIDLKDVEKLLDALEKSKARVERQAEAILGYAKALEAADALNLHCLGFDPKWLEGTMLLGYMDKYRAARGI